MTPSPIEDELPVALGEIVDGKYRIEAHIGSGGMGCVAKATHLQLLRSVAIKFLAVASTDKAWSTRLLREARATASLRAENVAQVFDVGSLPSGTPYVVMEFLEGETLSSRLDALQTMPWDEVVGIAIQVAGALGDAHRHSVIHRDVKPSNVFLVRRNDGRVLVKLLDFGIAKVEDVGAAVEHGLTTTGQTLGTPRYMSPEQIGSSREVGPPSDVWSLGVVMFECLTGRSPFASDTPLGVGVRILTEPAPAVTTLKPDVPDWLEDVVSRCLEKEASARFVDGDALRAALESRGTSTVRMNAPTPTPTPRPTPRLTPVPVPVPVPVPTPILAAPTTASAPASSSPSRFTPSALHIGAVVVGVMLVVALFGMRRKAPPQMDGTDDPPAQASAAPVVGDPGQPVAPLPDVPAPATTEVVPAAPSASSAKAAASAPPATIRRRSSPTPHPSIKRPPDER